MAWACACGARNAERAALCDMCGDPRPMATPAHTPAARLCPLDGTTLRADGYCERGGGWPITIRDCPDVCPHCRKPLSWSGDCYACRPAEKPGHLYDYDPYTPHDPRSGHWHVIERGPQPIASPTVALEAMQQVDASLSRMTTRARDVQRPVQEQAL